MELNRKFCYQLLTIERPEKQKVIVDISYLFAIILPNFLFEYLSIS